MGFIGKSISARVVAAFSCILVVVFLLGATAINRLGAVNDHAADVRDNYLPSMALNGRMLLNLTQMRADESKLLIRSGNTDIADLSSRIAKSRELLAAEAKQYEPMIIKDTDDEKFMRIFAENFQTYQQTSAKVIDQIKGGDFDAASATLFGADRKAFEAARDALDSDLAFNEAGGKRAANEGEAIYVSTRAIVYGALAAAVVLSVIIGYALIRSVSTPVKAMTGAMTRLAAHDLAAEIPSRARRDEIGAMAGAVQVFKDSMIKADELAEAQKAEQKAKEARAAKVNALTQDFDVKVGAVVQSVSAQATQMEGSAQSLSATAEESTKQASTVAAASEQASANVQTVAAAAEELSSSISEIGRQVAQSRKVASNAVNDAKSANQMVQGLVSASQKIGDVVALITDIANQTNLLALNATIEAARAGEAGKGFAVVAAEVKSLASQTAKATDEIGTQITEVQSATQNAVEAISTIGRTIDEINVISSAIAAAVEEQDAATKEIARNVEQASIGTKEVSNNITGVSQAANDTGAAASQVFASARDLSEQSVALKSIVDSFLSNVKAA